MLPIAAIILKYAEIYFYWSLYNHSEADVYLPYEEVKPTDFFLEKEFKTTNNGVALRKRQIGTPSVTARLLKKLLVYPKFFTLQTPEPILSSINSFPLRTCWPA